jgi:SHS2 domain-containing protein
MPYSFLEHTADVKMRVEDGTLPGLFEQALAGMFFFLRPKKRAKEVTRHITLHAADNTALLVDFLNEALTLAQSNKEMYESVRFAKLIECELAAELQGHKVSAFVEDIKAATYHQATIERVPKVGWRAQIIFDI